jgi:ribokinase
VSILVFGSINMDLVCRVDRLPLPGETLPGSAFFSAPGGKGANQAAACARLGAEVKLIGRVGEDVFGSSLREGLHGCGVDVCHVTVIPGASGVALITVDRNGENSIVIVPGANGQVGGPDLEVLDPALENAHTLLLQLEIPMEAVLQAARRAHSRGVRVVLDPAPALPLPEELYRLVDVLTPNENECAALVGFPVHDLPFAEHAADVLLRRGVRQVVIKLGARGAYLHDGESGEMVPGFPVEALDTTAAGDAFNGALAVALGNGHPLRQAVRFANAAGALSATRQGAQPSMPTRQEVEEFLNSRRDLG